VSIGEHGSRKGGAHIAEHLTFAQSTHPGISADWSFPSQGSVGFCKTQLKFGIKGTNDRRSGTGSALTQASRLSSEPLIEREVIGSVQNKLQGQVTYFESAPKFFQTPPTA